MKTKFTTFCVAITLLLSSCAKETFYFTNTGTSYGSKKVQPEATAATTTDQTASTADVTALEKEENANAAENLTASTDQTIALTKKDFKQPKALYHKQVAAEAKTEKVSKIAEVKTAIKVNKQVKAIVKEAKKNNAPGTMAEGDGKSQVIALILAALVGALGIHRFYLGYIGIGIAQLFTLGGCGVWALIDLIRIITGDLKPKDGDYTTKL